MSDTAAYSFVDDRRHAATTGASRRPDTSNAHERVVAHWKVPLLVDGKPASIEGALRYRGIAEWRQRVVDLGATAGLTALLLLVVWITSRRVRTH